MHDEFDTVDVDELYRENIGDNTKIVDVDIKGIPFKIVHSKNYMKTKEKTYGEFMCKSLGGSTHFFVENIWQCEYKVGRR